jgi:hypothetical protein
VHEFLTLDLRHEAIRKDNHNAGHYKRLHHLFIAPTV